MRLRTAETRCFEKAKMIKHTWIETLLMAFPIIVDTKNTVNGICKCPHVNPAKSKRGFGI